MTEAAFSLPPEWAPQSALWCGWPRLAEEWGGNYDGARAEIAALIRAASAFVTVKVAAGSEEAARSAQAAVGDVAQIIEVPTGGEPVKYEFDKASGALFVDRFLYTPMRYPGNYGFVPHTLSDDGDPIDVLVANTRPIIPGAVINVRPIGVLRMEDDGGGDEKIIAVPSPKLTQRYVHVKTVGDLPEITRQQIEHFFANYKDLEKGKWVKIEGWAGADAAREAITKSVAAYKG